VKLVFAGDGEDRAAMEDYVQKHGLADRIQFLGRVDRARLKQLLLDSDIYCLPTLKDNGGNAIFEAMACGLPVITSNYGGPAYSVTPECGILIDPISVDDYVEKLVNALELLVTNKELRRQMGACGRAHVVNNYSASVLKDNILDFYRKNI
jgi:glycosyltransferase involved in cell wall biosynthesis